MLVGEICDHLIKQMSRPIRMDDLELRFGRPRKVLNEEFEKHLGCTVFAWYRQRKMAYAVYLLETSDLGVEEIAQTLGYASVCNFSTAFRQSSGLSPRAYRQRRSSSAGRSSAGAGGTTPGIS